ncbi:MAG: C_GCAxxG_C_C family protein [Ruminococcaceae bacterium]|nr:C_GCAxxG_C_C family protein [Oscillospiraceae bacterium]
MASMEMAYKMYLAGFSCGQIVATCCSEVCNFDEKIGRAALGGFGGGMHQGENCSAVIGAVVSLGLYCNHSEYNDQVAKEKIKEMTLEFTKRFKNEYGSLTCRELMTGDLHRCGGFIDFAEKTVKELVEADKAKP